MFRKPLQGGELKVARFLSIWHQNPLAPSPTDPSEIIKLNDKLLAAVDSLIKKGEIEQFGFFPDGISGYTIGKGDPTDIYRIVSMFLPYFHCEIHGIVPYEKTKEMWQSTKEGLKAQITKK